jgi:hypothetical protein
MWETLGVFIEILSRGICVAVKSRQQNRVWRNTEFSIEVNLRKWKVCVKKKALIQMKDMSGISNIYQTLMAVKLQKGSNHNGNS